MTIPMQPYFMPDLWDDDDQPAPAPLPGWQPGEMTYGDWTSDGAAYLSADEIEAIMAEIREPKVSCRITGVHTILAKDADENGGGWTNCWHCFTPVFCTAPEAPSCYGITPEGRCVRKRGHIGLHEGRTGMLFR